MSKKQELEEIKLRNDKLVEDVKLFFLEKLNEMDEFIKIRNTFGNLKKRFTPPFPVILYIIFFLLF